MVRFILQCYNEILLTDPGQDAFYHASNRTTRVEANAVLMFRQLEEVNAEKDAVNKMKVELETKLRNLE